MGAGPAEGSGGTFDVPETESREGASAAGAQLEASNKAFNSLFIIH